MKIVPFADEHLDAAAEMLAARHARHRAAEPLLPADVDFRAQVEREWSADGASGVISPHGYLFGRPDAHGLTVGIGGHAVTGDAEHARDLYAAAAAAWVEAGHRSHMVFVPSSDEALIDAWFRLSFGASAVLATRETAGEPPYDGDVAIRPGTPDDFGSAARLELAMFESMQPSPSFSTLQLQTPEEVEAEWREDDFSPYELFVAERDGSVVGHLLLYRRPPDLRVPARRDRPRPGLDVSRGARHRRRPGAHRARDPLGSRARSPDDDHGLADDESLGVALLAAPRFPDDVPPAQPRDP